MASTASSSAQKATVVKSLLGHKGRCFDVRYCSIQRRLISASEDGNCKVWDHTTGRCTKTIIHNREAESLRATFLRSGDICTAGSDGNASIWRSCSSDQKMEKVHVLQHGDEAQIYVCETTDAGNELLTAADDYMVLWDLSTMERKYEQVFYALDDSAGQPSFGGHRNPENQVFVFDAKLNPQQDSAIAVALSDSTTRIIDYRSADHGTVASLSLQKLFAQTNERIGHATSISWSTDGNTLAVSLGSGQTALVDTRQHQVRALLKSHVGPCYGALLVDDGSRCISWSSDCTVRTWDVSAAQGLCTTPLSVQIIPDFPILAAAWEPELRQLVCAGGGGNVGSGSGSGGAGASGEGNKLKSSFSFVGTPIYVLGEVLPAVVI